MRLDPFLRHATHQHFMITGVLYWGGIGNGSRFRVRIPRCQVPRAARTRGHKLCDRNNRSLFPSPFWRPEFQNQRVGRVGPFSPKESLIQATLPASYWWSAALGLYTPHSGLSPIFPFLSIPVNYSSSNQDSRHWIQGPSG